MSLLDDAEQLLNEMDPGFQGMCNFCHGTDQVRRDHIEHRPSCVYLRRDKIIAALQAATVMATRMARQHYCNGCGRTGEDLHLASSHSPTCERWALISAIQGDAVDETDAI